MEKHVVTIPLESLPPCCKLWDHATTCKFVEDTIIVPALRKSWDIINDAVFTGDFSEIHRRLGI